MAATRTQLGLNADRPKILGAANDADAIYVEATGLFAGIRVGQRVWVTGSQVEYGLANGNIVEISEDQGRTVQEGRVRTRTSREATSAAGNASEPHDQPSGEAPSAAGNASEPHGQPSAEAPSATGNASELRPENAEPDSVDETDTGDDETFDPSTVLEGSVPDVLGYVSDHPEHREAILKAEQKGKNRTTLVEPLSQPAE